MKIISRLIEKIENYEKNNEIYKPNIYMRKMGNIIKKKRSLNCAKK